MFSNKDLKNLIVPLIIEQLLVMLVGITDTMTISYAGEAAISGVSLVNMVITLVIYVLSAIATGGAVIVSQYLGNKDVAKGRLAASQLITISFLISMVLMGGMLLFGKPLLSLLFGSVEPAVMDAALIYYKYNAISLPFLALYNSTAALFRSMSKTNVTMYISILMNVVNIGGDMIGIFGLKAGVLGTSVPTLLSRVVAGLLMFYLAFNHKNSIYLKFKEIFMWNKEIINKILSLAIPNGIENGLFHFGKLVVTSIVAMFGTTYIAANGISNSINQIVPIVVNALNLAVVTVVGQCVGSNDYTQAKYYIKKLMKVAYIASGILNVVVFLLLPYILKIYSLSPEVAEITYILVISHNLMALVLHPTSFVLANAIRAAGDVKFTMYVGILSMLIFRLGTTFIFGVVLQWGIYGVWLAMGLDWLGRSVAFVYRYLSGKWENYRFV